MRNLIWFLLLVTSISISFSTTHTVTNSGFAFSPSSLTINLGDTVSFVLASSHDAVEVSQTTWNANGNTSNGGFSTPFGGGKVIIQTVGTKYYVCSPHATFGMKGTITVNTATEVSDNKNTNVLSFNLFQNYPNPFNPITTIRYVLPQTSHVTLKIYNVIGQVVTTLVDGVELAGYKSVEWNASHAPSGVYTFRIQARQIDGGQASNFTQTKKLLLIK